MYPLCICLRCTNVCVRNFCVRLASSSIEKPVETKYMFYKETVLRELDKAKRCVLFAYNCKDSSVDNEENGIQHLKKTTSYNTVIEQLNKKHGDVKSICRLSKGLFCVEFQKDEIVLWHKIVAVKNFSPKMIKLDQPEAFEGNFTQHLEKLYDHVKLTKNSYQLSCFSAEFVRSFINMTDHSALVIPFGSAVSGHGIKGGSDLDLMWFKEQNTMHPDTSHRDDLLKVAKTMKRSKDIFMNMIPILHARVPIIRFNFRITGDSVDLSRGMMSGPLMAETLVWLNEYDDRFSKLTLMIKLLAKSQGVVRSGCSKISSNTLTLLVIAFLQSKRLLPPINEAYNIQDLIESQWTDFFLTAPKPKPTIMRDTASLGTLFQEFFAFYLETDLRKVCVNVYQGEIHPRPFNISSTLCVFNPCDLKHNVALNVNSNGLNLFTDFCRETLVKVTTTKPKKYSNIWFKQWF